MERKISSEEQGRKISGANLLESMLNDLDDTCEAQFQDEEEEFFESETKIMAEEIVTETINFAIELLAAEIREAEIARRLEECQAEISSENLVRPSEVRKSQRFSKNSKSQAKKPQPETSNLIKQTTRGEQPQLKEEPEQSKDVVSNTDAADCRKEAVSELKTEENEEKEEKTESEIEALESSKQASAEKTTTNNHPPEIPESAEIKEKSKTKINTNNEEKVQETPKSEEPISSPEAPKVQLETKPEQAPIPAPQKIDNPETNSTKLDCASISKSSAAGSSFTKSQRRKSFPRFHKKGRRGSLKESSLFSCIMPKVKDTEDASITSLKSAIPKSSRYEEKSSCHIM